MTIKGEEVSVRSQNRSSIRRTADATPRASSLIESLRDIGYSLETALADIIDNSLTAGAKNIRILADTLSDEPAIGIFDDGVGMDEKTLVEAMRPGSRNPLDDRSADDLGRFGLGLKSASFSQCRRLTVLSRRDGKVVGATWDLDEVAKSDRWEVFLHDSAEGIPWGDRLEKDGTLVVWEKLDRLDGGFRHDGEKRAAQINSALADAERHLRLVFHRFMNRGGHSVRFSINGRQLSPIDPFASNHSATQPDPEEVLKLARGEVRIRSFTLPHHKAMTKAEWDEIGGPGGHLKTQGFYVYRGDRLIIVGSWLGLARQTELTKLCRIRVDIPNTMDAEWKIDVKKASAQLPPVVRERLKRVVERFVQTSKRTYTRRGQKLTDETRAPLWQRIQKDGAVVYRPNADHPVVTDYLERLPEELRQGFRNCVSLIGAGLPMEALHADMMGQAEAVRADDADEGALDQAVRSLVPHLMEQGISFSGIRTMLKSNEMFRGSWKNVEAILDQMETERQSRAE